MTGLLIFIEIALAGCGFLLYFLYKLWQDSRKSGTRPRVEIRRFPARPAQRAKILHLYSTEELAKRSSARKSRL
jgi:hypothetical protein